MPKISGAVKVFLKEVWHDVQKRLSVLSQVTHLDGKSNSKIVATAELCFN